MPASNARNVSLTAEQDALVERLVSSGRYASASEVIRDGLRLLQREEEARLLEQVEHAEAIEGIRRGLDAMKRGDTRPLVEVLDDLRRKYE